MFPVGARGSRPIEVIGASIGLGGRCLGSAAGPAAIRDAGLLEVLIARGRVVQDAGVVHDVIARATPRTPGRAPGQALIDEVERFSLALRARVESALERGALPLILGGDHSLGAATQSAVARVARRHAHPVPGLLWIDAHTDSNTMETTPSGNLHGVMLAALHGLDVPPFRRVVEGGLRDPSRTVYLGARDIDGDERRIVERLGCRIFTPEEVRARGPELVAREACAIAAGRDGTFSVSFDLDSLDPSIAPGVDCLVPGGFAWPEAETILRIVGAHRGVLAVEVVEVNPDADMEGRTALLAVEAAALLCAGA